MAVATGTALAVAAAAAPVVGGVVGAMSSAGDRRRAQEAMQRAFEELRQLPGAGPDQTKAIIYKSFDDAGVLTPQLEQAIEMDAPKLAQLAVSPEFAKKEIGRAHV